MSYNTIQPPFTLQFKEMSKAELRQYFQWFLAVLPERIQGLAAAVRGISGFEAWRADETPGSLDALGDWFAIRVETRPLSHQEREDCANRLSFTIDVPVDDLTNVTLSISMDIGMYLAMVFLKNHPVLRWEQPLNGKQSANYGQPVLVGFSSVPLNPVRIAITLAYALVSKERTGKRLREIYEYWSKLA